MNIDQWWPRLDTKAQAWLIEHNGEPVSAEVLSAITAAGGVSAADSRWLDEAEPEDVRVSDEAVDWIEAVANGESPDG